MLHYGEEKVGKLKDRGFDDALLYNPEGVGGLHMMYVVPRGEMLDEYGLPDEPTVKGASFFPVMSGLRKLGSVATWAGLFGAAVFFLRTGRKFPPSEDKAIASAREKGRETEGGDPPPQPEPREGGQP